MGLRVVSCGFVFALYAIALGICSKASVPLPSNCLQVRADNNQDLNVPAPSSVNGSEECDRIQRAFFRLDKLCKKFSSCVSVTQYLDGFEPGTINYFQDKDECTEYCTGVVQCPSDLLMEINHGSSNLSNATLGYGESVRFECNKGFRLIGDTIRTCGLNGTWSGHQPTCEIQCSTPESSKNATFSPVQQYYTVGQQVRFDCMDGLVGDSVWTCLTDGRWKGLAPDCSLACSADVIDNAYPPELSSEADPSSITYRCLEGYHLLGNATVPCSGATLGESPPLCTKANIVSRTTAITVSEAGELDISEGVGVELECILDGVDEHIYPVTWTLPRKPNGEPLPGITVIGPMLTVSRPIREHAGQYTCSIANIKANITIRIRDTSSSPPVVNYMDPTGLLVVQPEDKEDLMCLTTGSAPLNVSWMHNNLLVKNNSLANISQYTISVIHMDVTDAKYTILTIKKMSESAEGGYRCVAINDVGEAQSEGVELQLEHGEHQRERRKTDSFCSNQSGKVAVVARVRRRPQKTTSGLTLIKVQVLRAIRGGGTVLKSMEVVVPPILDIGELQRRQLILVTAVPYKHQLLTISESPIRAYSLEQEMAIAAC